MATPSKRTPGQKTALASGAAATTAGVGTLVGLRNTGPQSFKRVANVKQAALATTVGGAGLMYAARRSRQKGRLQPIAKRSLTGKDWTKDDISDAKRTQAYLTAGGSALGVAALGTKGGASVASRMARSRPKGSWKLRSTANRLNSAAENATIGAAGVGGVSGFNFAAIQRAEGKKKKR